MSSTKIKEAIEKNLLAAMKEIDSATFNMDKFGIDYALPIGDLVRCKLKIKEVLNKDFDILARSFKIKKQKSIKSK